MRLLRANGSGPVWRCCLVAGQPASEGHPCRKTGTSGNVICQFESAGEALDGLHRTELASSDRSCCKRECRRPWCSGRARSVRCTLTFGSGSSAAASPSSQNEPALPASDFRMCRDDMDLLQAQRNVAWLGHASGPADVNTIVPVSHRGSLRPLAGEPVSARNPGGCNTGRCHPGRAASLRWRMGVGIPVGG